MANSEYSTFEEYKNSVYKCVGMVESMENDFDDIDKTQPSGCLNILFMNFASKMVKLGKKQARKKYREEKYVKNADIALSNEIIKNAICADLKGTEKLPIDIANVVTQSLYNLPADVKGNFDLNAMVVAYMCYKLSKIGVENYCKS